MDTKMICLAVRFVLQTVESVCFNRLCMSTVTMAFTAGVFSIFSRETPLLVGDMLVNFGHILPETSKGSAC